MLVGLPMYDRPELQPATDQLWYAIAQRLNAAGIDAPHRLNRDWDEAQLWRHPDLLLAMTCGRPYRRYLHQHVAVVGAFDYALPDCPAGYYYSVIVARADSDDRHLTGRRFVYNATESESGFWCVARMLGTLSGFSQARPSGSHQRSVEMIIQRQADIAAIDAVTWRYISKSDPEQVNQLQVLAKTPPTPGLPLITARPNWVEPLRSAIRAGLVDAAAAANQLSIAGLVAMEPAAYLALGEPDRPLFGLLSYPTNDTIA